MKIRMISLLVVSCLGFSGDKAAELEALFAESIAEGTFNGAVMVVDDNKVIYQMVHGLANAAGDPLSIDHNFNLASVTKPLTAFGIMVLVEEGKLGFDDDIKRFYPELPYEGVSIRHLLNHTSGLPDYMDLLQKYWDLEETDIYKKKRRKTTT